MHCHIAYKQSQLRIFKFAHLFFAPLGPLYSHFATSQRLSVVWSPFRDISSDFHSKVTEFKER
jgi:hypothetical protein